MPPLLRMMRIVGQQVLIAALTFALFFASTRYLTVEVFVPVSLMAGLGVAAVLLCGRRSVIALTLGMLAAQRLQLEREWPQALTMTAMFGAQCLAGWYLVVRVFRGGKRFDRPRDVVMLAAAGAIGGGLRVLIQVPILLREQRIPADLFGFASASLWISPLAGVMVFAPALLAVARGRLFSESIARKRELIPVMLLGVAMQATIFLVPPARTLGMMMFSLTVLPLLCWIAIRGTASATAATTGVLAIIVMYATAHGLGPFAGARCPGSVRLVQTTLMPVGAFMLLLSSAEMSRRRAMQALNASKAQMERALDASDSGLWEWRANTQRNSYDARVARIFGEEADAGLHLPAGRYRNVHPDDEDRLRSAMQDHVEGRTPGFEVEIRHQHRDGNYVWVLDRGRVTDRAPDGTPLLLSGTVTDITARKKIEMEHAAFEERVLQAQKLEGLGLLAGGVAHDFNNILTSVLGHADLARREVPSGSVVHQHLDHIVAGARAAADLTRQMLAFAGRGHVATQPVSLTRLVAEMGHLLQVSISRNVTLRYDFAPGIPAVEADPAQMRQVVMNLILNAAESFGTNAGVITVRVHEQYCDRTMLTSRWVHEALPEGVYVVLEVRDEGSGMPAETLARIFDPFFSTKFTGRGLGLAAVLGIVRGHHGSVLVETAPGRGTAFRMMLPASTAVAHTEDRGPVAPTWSGEGRALVVDDEDSVRMLAEVMLRRVGFEVVTAANGTEALERFRAEPDSFRVVLLDLTMPGMDGLAVAREMYAIHPEVRIVLTTGYSAPPWPVNETPAGMVGFLEKPYRLEDLARVLRQSLETVRA